MKTKNKSKKDKSKCTCPKCEGKKETSRLVLGGLDVHRIFEECNLGKGTGKLY